MLEIQKYLKSGKTLDNLKDELGIENTVHPELPLVILNYSQIESPKTNPLVREARGLILNSENYDLVARSFPRFFNLGEAENEKDFNWEDFSAQEKVDGSLCLFYNFDGEWYVNTRGSFADGQLLNADWQKERYPEAASYTWRDAILKGLGVKNLKELNLDPALTYVGEFCSRWNKVVMEYPQPKVVLLTRFAGEEEIGPVEFEPFHKFNEYPLKTVSEVLDFVRLHYDSTFEGVVLKDSEKRRIKCKNPRYLAYHKMKGANGDGLYHPKNLVPFILSGEEGELLAIYPEIKDYFLKQKAKVDDAFNTLVAVWTKYWQIELQKDFALAIIKETKFSGILFNLRKKYGKNQTLALLKEDWRKSEDVILKLLF